MIFQSSFLYWWGNYTDESAVSPKQTHHVSLFRSTYLEYKNLALRKKQTPRAASIGSLTLSPFQLRSLHLCKAFIFRFGCHSHSLGASKSLISRNHSLFSLYNNILFLCLEQPFDFDILHHELRSLNPNPIGM